MILSLIKKKKFKYDDVSSKYNDTWVEIPPFTKNEKGEWLNDSAVSKWVKGDKFNVDEFINSFKDSVDLAHIIDLVMKTGDRSYLNQRQGFYADISDLPNDANTFNEKINDYVDFIAKMDPDVAKKIVNGESNDDIYSYITKKYGDFSEEGIKKDDTGSKKVVEPDKKDNKQNGE